MQIYRPTDEEQRELARLLAARYAALEPPFQTDHQVLGRRSTIGCVALEITQRCNLDCTLCYLSEYSEAVPDPPMEELKQKADNIKRIFGVQTNVQITGGDPTLRKREELVEIVRYVASIGLYPALFTNGIRASRDLLAELRDNGLVDLALHVDMTQERKGYKSEVELHAVREKYLERARGLGLAVIFNTTVFDGNVHEVPELVRWFVAHAGDVGMASFQMQADTGRGVLHQRGEALTRERMTRLIDEACGTKLSWDNVLFGHPQCHNIAYALVAGDTVADVFDQREIVARWMEDFALVPMDRTRPVGSALAIAKHMLTKKPGWLRIGGRWALRLLGRIGPAAVRARKVSKLSFFIQNFQDAESIDMERIRQCSFHVATRDGTVSMCEHNARRDDYIIPANLVRGVDIKPERPPIAAVHAATRADR
jgi:uncharacterized radical SAM superfamily Fe-S cluster-containing enzyme